MVPNSPVSFDDRVTFVVRLGVDNVTVNQSSFIDRAIDEPLLGDDAPADEGGADGAGGVVVRMPRVDGKAGVGGNDRS